MMTGLSKRYKDDGERLNESFKNVKKMLQLKDAVYANL